MGSGSRHSPGLLQRDMGLKFSGFTWRYRYLATSGSPVSVMPIDLDSLPTAASSAAAFPCIAFGCMPVHLRL